MKRVAQNCVYCGQKNARIEVTGGWAHTNCLPKYGTPRRADSFQVVQRGSTWGVMVKANDGTLWCGDNDSQNGERCFRWVRLPDLPQGDERDQTTSPWPKNL